MDYKKITAARDALRSKPGYAEAFEGALVRYHNVADKEALKIVCPHPTEYRQYHADPRANNASGTRCEICGTYI